MLRMSKNHTQTVPFSHHGVSLIVTQKHVGDYRMGISWPLPEEEANGRYRKLMRLNRGDADIGSEKMRQGEVRRCLPKYQRAVKQAGELVSQGFRFEPDSIHTDLIHPDGTAVGRFYSYSLGYAGRRKMCRNIAALHRRWYQQPQKETPWQRTLQQADQVTTQQRQQILYQEVLSRPDLPVDEAIRVLDAVQQLPVGTDIPAAVQQALSEQP